MDSAVAHFIQVDFLPQVVEELNLGEEDQEKIKRILGRALNEKWLRGGE
jgi:hypothetical protein